MPRRVRTCLCRRRGHCVPRRLSGPLACQLQRLLCQPVRRQGASLPGAVLGLPRLRQRRHHQPQAAVIDRVPELHGGAARSLPRERIGPPSSDERTRHRGANSSRVSAGRGCRRTEHRGQPGRLALPSSGGRGGMTKARERIPTCRHAASLAVCSRWRWRAGRLGNPPWGFPNGQSLEWG